MAAENTPKLSPKLHVRGVFTHMPSKHTRVTLRAFQHQLLTAGDLLQPHSSSTGPNLPPGKRPLARNASHRKLEENAQEQSA